MAKSTWISIFLQQLLTLISIMILSVIQEISALRCYECNPASAFSISGSYSSSSSFASSNNNNGVYSSSTSDCYNADSRQIKDCPWDSQSCYTVVLPGPQSSSGIVNSKLTFPQNLSPDVPVALPHQGQTVFRGCGPAPYVKPGDLGQEECKVLTVSLPPSVAALSGSATQTRATICQCRSTECNNKRPDQLPSAGFSSSITTPWTAMSGTSRSLSPYGSGSPYPGMNRETSAVGYGSPHSADRDGYVPHRPHPYPLQPTSYAGNPPPVMYYGSGYGNENYLMNNQQSPINTPFLPQQAPSNFVYGDRSPQYYPANPNFATQNIQSTAYGPDPSLYNQNNRPPNTGFYPANYGQNMQTGGFTNAGGFQGPMNDPGNRPYNGNINSPGGQVGFRGNPNSGFNSNAIKNAGAGYDGTKPVLASNNYDLRNNLTGTGAKGPEVVEYFVMSREANYGVNGGATGQVSMRMLHLFVVIVYSLLSF
ncbi:hypothetical protein RvY_14939-1 [Ramazzottius varieornatus]|uniref:Uncharacterized protein n=1 Tax=Ramazzottius varieornatus TaxID=947166 RepID=A0A1D1W077_RAMVA|nr:hypothetical protein RvY_14939-1 [Ramazzottius varieornatus]